jgi:type II secretory pathway component PulK
MDGDFFIAPGHARYHQTKRYWYSAMGFYETTGERMSLQKQKGAALLTAILITSVVAVLAANILTNQQEWINQTGLADRQDRFNLIADRILDWANTAASMRSGAQDPSQLPAWPSFEKTMQGIDVVAKLTDGNTRYNINWLVDPAMDNSFARLIQAVQPDMDPKKSVVLAQWVTAMIQQNQGIKPTMQTKAKGPDDRRGVPVIGPLHDKTQLLSLPGMTASLLSHLDAYISFLPVSAGINITTGDLVVIKALLKPSQDEDNLWMAYLSCRQSFTDQQPNANAWQACLQQNDGQNFLTNFGARDAVSTSDTSNAQSNSSQANSNNTPSSNQQLLIYRSNYAVLRASMKQTDLTSTMSATYWLPNLKKQANSGNTAWLARDSFYNSFTQVTLVGYWRN